MKRLPGIACVALAVVVLGAVPGYADRLRGVITAEYGTATSIFGLSASQGATSLFDVPTQGNASSDFVLSGILEYDPVRRWPLELGVAVKGSFAFSSWNLGAPPTGVYDSASGQYDLGDQIHVSAEWWALALMGTAHVRLGPFVTLDGAIGYGPYGYLNANYWDDYGLVTGPVVLGTQPFVQNAWVIDWSAGLSFGFFPLASFLVDVGMMGPDFVAGLGVGFPL